MLSYSRCVELLGKRDKIKLAGNTYLHRGDKVMSIVLYSTKIVEIHEDGSYVLSTGGHRTATTKRRINTYAPDRVYQSKGILYHNMYAKDRELHDGMIVRA